MARKKAVDHSQDTRTFLNALFGDKPTDAYALLWTLPGKASHWFADVDAMVAEVEALSTTSDVYCGAALSRADLGKHQRGQAKDAHAIVGLWADVDYNDPSGLQTKQRPPDERAAHEVIKSMGLDPTIVVHSGHGLQAWWLFAEPWILDSEHEWEAAQQLSKRWNGTMRAHALSMGQWVIDATHDLSRVMRVPGTHNNKADPQVPVVLLSHNAGTRYDPGDFDGYLSDEGALAILNIRRPAHHVSPNSLTLDTNAMVDGNVLDALIENDSRFAKTWRRQRKDLADQSASTYDMALASQLVAAGWENQPIVDLLIASRRKHGDDLKCDRPDYYAMTLERAKTNGPTTPVVDEVTMSLRRLEEARVTNVDTASPVGSARRDLLDKISDALGIEVVHVERHLVDPTPQWALITMAGPVPLPSSQVLFSHASVRAAIVGVTRHVIPRFKRGEWDALVVAIVGAAEDVSLGAEATNPGLAHAWVTSLFMERAPTDDLSEAAKTKYPYVDVRNSEVYVFGTAITKHIEQSRGEKVTPLRLGQVLRSIGCEPCPLHVKDDETGKRSTINAWKLPAELSRTLLDS